MFAQALRYVFHKLTRAICQFNCPDDYGYAILTEYQDKTVVELYLKNLKPGKHGIHIHEYADKRKGCDSMGTHYNPYDGVHGDVNEKGNHLGDLGNIFVEPNGECNQKIFVDDLPLSGPHSIIGRGMVIHEHEDDLGTGGDEESMKTGHSGGRVTCGIIGYCE